VRRIEKCDEANDTDFVLMEAASQATGADPRPGHVRRSFALAHALAIDLEQRCHRPLTKPLDLLAVLRRGERTVRLEVSGAARHRALIEELIHDRLGSGLVDGLVRRAAKMPDVVQFTAEASDPRPTQALDDLANRLLSELLVTLRRVAACRVTGRIAFDLRERVGQDFGRLRGLGFDGLRSGGSTETGADAEPSPAAREYRDANKNTTCLLPYIRRLVDPSVDDITGVSEADDERLDRFLLTVPLDAARRRQRDGRAATRSARPAPRPPSRSPRFFFKKESEMSEEVVD